MTTFRVWLLKLGIEMIHARPYHPQSLGKNERFHRSMDDEVFAMRQLADHAEAQKAFDAWRTVYNFERPHEGIGFATPAQRYRPSPRAYARQTARRRIRSILDRSDNLPDKRLCRLQGQELESPRSFRWRTANSLKSVNYVPKTR